MGPGSRTSPLPSHHSDGCLPSQPLCHLVLFCGCSDQPQRQRGGTARIPANSHGWAQREQTQHKCTSSQNTRRCPGGHFWGRNGLARAVAQTLHTPGMRSCTRRPGCTALAHGCAHQLLLASTSLSLAPRRRKPPCFWRELCCVMRLHPLSCPSWQRNQPAQRLAFPPSHGHAGPCQQGQQA